VRPPARIKILVLDDEPELLPQIRSLEEAGYSLIVARSSDEARSLLRDRQFDIAILDVNLLPGRKIDEIKDEQRKRGEVPYVPEENEGFRVATWMRENFPSIGTIIHTGQAIEAKDIVTGLDCGADDYVDKNSPITELPARVRALYRRLKPEASIINIGQLRWSPSKRTLSNETGSSVALTSGEQKLLERLSQRPIRPVSRSDIYDWIRGEKFPAAEDRSVADMVSRLRSKTKSELGVELPVSTIYGGGYLLEE
jgi:DNA-binding response OmpR family regulator